MMDLNNKAKWHTDFNGGFIPMLESPDGTLVNETEVLLQFAYDYYTLKPVKNWNGVEKGLPLWPHEVAGADPMLSCMKSAE